MNLYLIGKRKGVVSIFKTYHDLVKAKLSFSKDVQRVFDEDYGDAFTFKVVKAASKTNAIKNYAKARNYMRKSGSKVGG